jgi:hypothetical protein
MDAIESPSPESPTVQSGRPLTGAERQKRLRDKQVREWWDYRDLRNRFAELVESEVARRVGELASRRLTDMVSGLSPVENLCMVESMLTDLDRQGRLKIAIGDVGKEAPATLSACFPHNLDLLIYVEPV